MVQHLFCSQLKLCISFVALYFITPRLLQLDCTLWDFDREVPLRNDRSGGASESNSHHCRMFMARLMVGCIVAIGTNEIGTATHAAPGTENELSKWPAPRVCYNQIGKMVNEDTLRTRSVWETA